MRMLTVSCASYDTEPSFLNYTISHDTSSQPSPKKAKVADSTPDRPSIADKLKSSSYPSLQHLRQDANHVCERLVSSIRIKAREREGFNAGRPTVEELKQIHKLQCLETLVKDIATKETSYVDAASQVSGKKDGNSSEVNDASSGRPVSVLTLFGNAPTPKQLFSSMQKPTGRKETFPPDSGLPVEEMSLPNGITVTKVMPVPAVESATGPTFEQAFPPPYALAPLQPPKLQRRSSARDQTVTWEFKDPVQRNKKGGYTVQPLTVGGWLSYGGLDGEDSLSVREKRKQRDRALSNSDGATQGQAKELSEEAMKKEEEALFRRAYSTFAPSRDDANVVVPTETKNLVWWYKTGEKRFRDTFAIDPALLDESTAQAPSFEPVPEVKEDEFVQVLEELEALDNYQTGPDPEPDINKSDVDQVLREVSELLETLASHQRIRNVSLPPASTGPRTSSSPAPLLASNIGKPDEPSDEEISTYNNLRRELAYLLLKLPPYAVAKLDGDQLADLGVKQLITFNQKDIKGVLEEDLVTRQAKLAAMATTNSIANLARPNSSAGQHYSQTAQRTPAIGQAANTRYGPQYASRAPVQQFQLSNNPMMYATPTTAVRPTYGQPNQYTRPGAPQAGYGQTNGQQYYQPRSFQQNYNPQYQQPAIHQRPGYALPQQQQYQQRSHAAAVGYQNKPIAQQQGYNHSLSPLKSGYPTPTMGMPPSSGQQRSMYPVQPQPQQSGSGRATPVSYPSQPQTPVNGAPPPPRPVQGLAPRPASTTPQPPQYQGPTQTMPQQQPPVNGTS
jgi:hypothetical protein